MIGRRSLRETELPDKDAKLKGFDDFELRLGDTMRGERATMGKSLLDVQRELRIKASYIAAIENCDPTAFDTPGFIAGYVRSYARYLGMDPDEAFAEFCEESGFSVAHGMSAGASVIQKSSENKGLAVGLDRDPLSGSNTPFVPETDGVFSQIDLRAIGSAFVLMALIGGIGYGGWTVLKEVQQVRVAPVDQAPVVLSDLDPLSSAQQASDPVMQGAALPSAEALDRLYRPQALDVPVLVARDAPISTLDPRSVGAFRAPELPSIQIGPDQIAQAPDAAFSEFPGAVPVPERVPQVVEAPAPRLQLVAVRGAWVQVQSADGTVIFESTLAAGDVYEPPLTEEPPVLWTGESGAIYFVVNDTFYGPVGETGAVTRNVAMSIAALSERLPVADLSVEPELIRYAEAQGIALSQGDE